MQAVNYQAVAVYPHGNGTECTAIVKSTGMHIPLPIFSKSESDPLLIINASFCNWLIDLLISSATLSNGLFCGTDAKA